ncbi:unnamed protein product [Tilletia laevis]|uniref:Origin recognition complex subunit 1 n=2 Tax=Tilletia TaxID=13289 RepID=A0A177UF56_9BASI|nr:hypothetical protein CF336_g4573 [Tilletia laevis]KAE8259168.1 hypothetical protein A4X03_0g4174 [Tilletia caries]KAE8200964.1 hypothetical protein CF335_g3841 [Tilletia laevis]CAD6885030.1 unnamed protein product [Tilletia caries]CAD6896867.1 unnamed protein product [Tilletia laevis]
MTSIAQGRPTRAAVAAAASRSRPQSLVERKKAEMSKRAKMAANKTTPKSTTTANRDTAATARAARAAAATARAARAAARAREASDEESSDSDITDLTDDDDDDDSDDSDSDPNTFRPNVDTDEDSDTDMDENESEWEDFTPPLTPSSRSGKRKHAPTTRSPHTPSKKARHADLPSPPSSTRSRKLWKPSASARAFAKELVAQRCSGFSSPLSKSSLCDPTHIASSQRDAENANINLAYYASLTAQQRAKRLLHVGLTPDKLPCREDEFAEIFTSVGDALQERVGTCLYVSGVPGTGKTATVRGVVRELFRRVELKQLRRFNFVEINGMKLGDPAQAYTMLWQAVRPDPEGKRPSPKFALAALNSYFSERKPNHGPPSPGRWRIGDAHTSSAQRPTVVLMDELDQLVNARQDVMYNLFNWGNASDSQLIVIAVANTMDLPERILKAKVASRLGMTRIPFESYKTDQLQEIVRTRLGVGKHDPTEILQALEADPRVNVTPEQRSMAELEAASKKDCAQLFCPDAIKFAATKIANVSGDVRRMLDVCRRAIEMVEAKAEKLIEKEQADKSLDGSGRAAVSRRNHRQTGTAATDHAKAVSAQCKKIVVKDMADVFDSMVKSGTVRHIASLSLSAKSLLVALLRHIRRSGLAEVRVGDVLNEQSNILLAHGLAKGTKRSKGEQANGWTDWDLTPNLADLDWALASLCRAGLVTAVGSGAGPGRAGINGRLSLACQEDEVRLALQTSTDKRLKSVL